MRTIRRALVLGALSALLSHALGCRNDPAPPPAPVAGGSTSAPAGSAAAPKGPMLEAKPKAETDSWILEVVPEAGAAAGKPSHVELKISSKAGYHINAEYPYKVVLDPPPAGVSWTKATLMRADGTFGEKAGSFKAGFTADKPGKPTLTGTVSLSVCSDATCVIDKVKFTAAPDVG